MTFGSRPFRLVLGGVLVIPFGYQFVVAGIMVPLTSLDVMRDFHVYYRAAQMVAGGRSPYDLSSTANFSQGITYIYGPALAIVLVPISRLPFGAAQLAWMVWSLGCLAIAVIATGKAAGARTAENWLWVGFTFVSSFPVVLNLQLGQFNTTLLALIGVWSWAHVRGLRTGWVLVGVATAVKVFTAPLLLIPVVRRDLRALLGAAVGGTAVLLVGVTYLPQFVFEVLPRLGAVSEAINNTSILASLARLTHPQNLHATRDDNWLDIRVIALLIALTTLVTCVIALRRLANSADGRRLEAALMLTAAPLFGSIVWEQHLVMLLPAIVIAARVIWKEGDFWSLGVLMFATTWMALGYPVITEVLAPFFNDANWVAVLYADQGGIDALIIFLVLVRTCFRMRPASLTRRDNNLVTLETGGAVSSAVS